MQSIKFVDKQPFDVIKKYKEAWRKQEPIYVLNGDINGNFKIIDFSILQLSENVIEFEAIIAPYPDEPPNQL